MKKSFLFCVANFMEDDGQCPLFWVLNCSNEVSRSLAIQYLLDAGADVNVVSSKNTALVVVIQC